MGDVASTGKEITGTGTAIGNGADNPATASNGNGADEVLMPGKLGGLRVYQAGEIQRPEYALFYSEPGVGKTPIVAGANRVRAFHPMLVIDCDDGPKSLRKRFPEIHVVSPKTLGQLQLVCDDLRHGKAKAFKSIFVDGVSTVQYRGLEHLLGKEHKYTSFIDFNRPGYGNGAWSSSATQMAILVELLKSIPYGPHLFLSAWAKNVAKATKENPDPPDSWQPAFTPAAADAVDGRFDSILYLYKERQNQKVVRKLRSVGTDYIMARDRDDRLPETITEPTMQLLAKYWGLDHSLVDVRN